MARDIEADDSGAPEVTTEAHTPPQAESRALQSAKAAGKWLGLDDALVRTLIAPGHSEAMPAIDRNAAAQLSYVARSLRRLVRSPTIGRRWLNGPNTGIGMRPIDLLRSPGGLKLLHDYLTQFERR